MQILRIDASARHDNSYSRVITDKLITKLYELYPGATILTRDIYKNGRFLTEAMVEGMATAETVIHDQDLSSLSNSLIEELLSVDILILAVPVYNFSIPAALKAYIDLIVRAGRTFRYGANGPEGLVKNLSVYIVITSNGTALRGCDDFASRYLSHVLQFIGVREIHFINGTQLLLKGVDRVMKQVEQNIKECFCPAQAS